MFGPPTRSNGKGGEAVYFLDVNATPLGIELEYTSDGLVYDKSAQPRFRTLQNLVISELAKERQLFKNPPTQASLEAITPNWGFVSSGGKAVFSPYSDLISDIKSDKLPCLVDIQLKRLEISRSTIRATWKLHYLGTRRNEIDFDFVAPVAPAVAPIVAEEITEVSDVDSTNMGTPLTLADPAARAREKEEAKAQIRAAFVAAREARTSAEELARNFYDSYDLSDSESAFTEWLSDSDLESDSD
jgi:hypothetical protein